MFNTPSFVDLVSRHPLIKNMISWKTSTESTRPCFHSLRFRLIDPCSIYDKCRSSEQGMTEGSLFSFRMTSWDESVIMLIGTMSAGLKSADIVNRCIVHRKCCSWAAFTQRDTSAGSQTSRHEHMCHRAIRRHTMVQQVTSQQDVLKNTRSDHM